MKWKGKGNGKERITNLQGVMEDAAEKKMQKWGGEKGNFFGTVF